MYLRGKFDNKRSRRPVYRASCCACTRATRKRFSACRWSRRRRTPPSLHCSLEIPWDNETRYRPIIEELSPAIRLSPDVPAALLGRSQTARWAQESHRIRTAAGSQGLSLTWSGNCFASYSVRDVNCTEEAWNQGGRSVWNVWRSRRLWSCWVLLSRLTQNCCTEVSVGC